MRLTYFSLDDFERLKAEFQLEASEGKRTVPCPLPGWIDCDCNSIKAKIGAEDHICTADGSCVVRDFIAEKERELSCS